MKILWGISAFDNTGKVSIIAFMEQTVLNFEQAFEDTEQAADSTLKSARTLVSRVNALKKAANTGNVAAIRRAQSELDDALNALRQEVHNAKSIWPFQEEEEKQYLDEQYTNELIRVAEEKGLNIYERDGSLISYPSIVRVLPGDRAVRIDRKRVPTIRPSHLADLLLKNQQKPLRRLPMTYLNALYTVYSDIVSGDSSDRMVNSIGRVVPLSRVYKLLTSLPGSSREYDRSDFARDLYIIDSYGPNRTTRGAVVSFIGPRRASRNTFSFVGPDGQGVDYFGIRFTEEG